jgi:integrase
MADDTPADPLPTTPAASDRKRFVHRWAEWLCAEMTPIADADQAQRRLARLVTQLAPVIRCLFPAVPAQTPPACSDTAALSPQIVPCPFSTRQSVANALKKLDEAIGADPERTTDLLLRIVDYGERHFGWQLPEAIASQIRLPRELPLVTAEEIVGLTGLARLQDALDSAVVHFAELNPQARAGQILYCAIVEGAMLRGDLQQGLLQTRREDLCITSCGTWLAIPLDRPPGEQTETAKNKPPPMADAALLDRAADAPSVAAPRRSERWWVRPATEMLLLRYWHEDPGRTFPPGSPWTLLKAYFQAAGVSPADRPSTLAVLNRWARAKHAFVLPPFLRETLTGRFRTQPLNDRVHRRFCLGEPVWQPDDQAPPRQKPALVRSDAAIPPSANVPASESSKCLRGILRPLGESPRSRGSLIEHMSHDLDRHAPRLDQMGWLIGQWCLTLLRARRPQLRVATIRRYVYPIRRYVLPAFAGTIPAALDDSQWLERFQDAIDRANDGVAPMTIDRFARFVVAQPDVPDFDPNELEGTEAVAHVDANLISVADFEAAMVDLQAPTPRDAEMSRLAGALGFYGGLRRGEVVHLRLGDISGSHAPWLLVRSHPDHRVKRFASQRQLPLVALLPKPWLDRLLAWVATRDHEGRSRSREKLLFSPPGTGFEPMAGEGLINPVRDAVRRVTRDHGLVFHHLRHSCANWTLIRLLAPELLLEHWRRRCAALDNPWFDVGACDALRRAILGRARNEPARHAAYALARLLGHAEVATTLRHYVHLTDLLAFGYQTREGTLQLSDDQIRALLGAGTPGGSPDATYHWWRRLRKKAANTELGGLRADVILETARRRTLGYDPDWSTVAAGATAPSPTAIPLVQPNALRLEDVPKLLGALFDRNQRVEDAARLFNLRPEQVHRVKVAATELAALRTKRRHQPRLTIPPIQPSGDADGDAYGRVLRFIAAHPPALDVVTAGVDLLRKVDPNRGHRIPIGNDNDAERFAALLHALGFGTASLRIDLYPREGDEEANTAHWAGLLGVKPEQVAIKRFKRVGPAALHGEIAITVGAERHYSRFSLRGRARRSDYDPVQAKRGLAELANGVIATGFAWTVADRRAVEDLAALLRGFGVAEHRIALDIGANRLVIAVADVAMPTCARRGLDVLARAMPHHDLRIVGTDEDDIVAAIAVLLAWGTGRERLHLDQTGVWDETRRIESRTRLIARTGLSEQQIGAKPRKPDPPRLSLTVLLDRGREEVKSWSLTYTLILLYIWAKAQVTEADAAAP